MPFTVSDARTPGSSGPRGLERWAHWPTQTESPYYSLFYAALAPHGVVPVATLKRTREWAASREADVVHFHWPDSFWRRVGDRPIDRARGTWRLREFIRAARRAGMRIVWTAHNHEAHEGSDWFDRWAYRYIARQADLILCHTRWSAELVARDYRPRGDLLIMPHGNFVGVYPPPRPREAVLAKYGLDPTRPLVSCVGNLRHYKGLELAAEAVGRLGGRVQLVIGGPPYKDYDLAPLRRAVAAVDGALLQDRWFDEQEFSDLTAASDAILLPYTGVTTSGVLLTAWSLGTGVICSDLPFFRELLPAPTDAGRVSVTGDIDSLAQAIREYVEIPRERRVAAAHREAQRYSWPLCVTPLVEWLSRVRPQTPAQAESIALVAGHSREVG